MLDETMGKPRDHFTVAPKPPPRRPPGPLTLGPRFRAPERPSRPTVSLPASSPRFLVFYLPAPGELVYQNTRAILLSDIGGAALAIPEGALLELADFRRLVRQALDAFAPFGMLHADSKLDNYHLTGDRVMVVDLERVGEDLDGEELDFFIDSEVKHLAKFYENLQYELWKDGLIAVRDQ